MIRKLFDGAVALVSLCTVAAVLLGAGCRPAAAAPGGDPVLVELERELGVADGALALAGVLCPVLPPAEGEVCEGLAGAAADLVEVARAVVADRRRCLEAGDQVCLADGARTVQGLLPELRRLAVDLAGAARGEVPRAR